MNLLYLELINLIPVHIFSGPPLFFDFAFALSPEMQGSKSNLAENNKLYSNFLGLNTNTLD